MLLANGKAPGVCSSLDLNQLCTRTRFWPKMDQVYLFLAITLKRGPRPAAVMSPPKIQVALTYTHRLVTHLVNGACYRKLAPILAEAAYLRSFVTQPYWSKTEKCIYHGLCATNNISFRGPCTRVRYRALGSSEELSELSKRFSMLRRLFETIIIYTHGQQHRHF